MWLWPLFHVLLSERAFLLVSTQGFFHKTDELGDPFVTIMPERLNCGHTDFEQSYHGLQNCKEQLKRSGTQLSSVSHHSTVDSSKVLFHLKPNAID